MKFLEMATVTGLGGLGDFGCRPFEIAVTETGGLGAGILVTVVCWGV